VFDIGQFYWFWHSFTSVSKPSDINHCELRFEQLTTEATFLTDELKETYPA